MNKELYDLMIKKGYPDDFTSIISTELCTDFTAQRMISYIARSGLVSFEEVADEMMAILSDREKCVNKHLSEHAQQSINEMYRNGLE